MADSKRVALVTGGNRGLGLETCRQLAQRGLLVVLASRRRDAGDAAAAELRSRGLDVEARELDVTDWNGAPPLIEEVHATFGRLDVLVNNAAIAPDGENSVFAVSLDAMRQALATNLLGALRLTQLVVPIMRDQRYGRIVNVSTGMAQLAEMDGGYAAYRISKTALNALTTLTTAELRGINVLVNSVCPGWVRTGMGGAGAPRSVEEGADTIVWAAMLPDDGPAGGFFRDRERLAW